MSSTTVSNVLDPVTTVSAPLPGPRDVAFTIGTLVTDPAQYKAMRDTYGVIRPEMQAALETLQITPGGGVPQDDGPQAAAAGAVET